MRYVTRDREAGNIIEEVSSMEEGLKKIEEYEQHDKELSDSKICKNEESKIVDKNTIEWAKEEIRRDQENIEELKELRSEAWSAGNRKLYDKYTKDIRELNEGIKGVQMAYNKIYELRAKTYLSQTAFGEKYGIPMRTIQNWEMFVNVPPAYVVNLLERVVTEDFD